MDRENALQLFFETINDSLEWGIGDSNYGLYVEGCSAMVSKLLDKLEEDRNTKLTHVNNSGTGDTNQKISILS